ncbi:hypothetical protein ULMA_26560 [Patiriisocius marinus]|uniref:Uncharacterized protein n=1 Tax=Patiriisocius marinus TaxID=1397112 RepID=A0A5J4J3C8_9FLAO|nr:hypothetical protein ULMA_26560 [Patiriisocius marinus]
MLGSMVQNGKLALCAFAFDKQLNKVDFPTLGNPTIPAFIKNLLSDLNGCKDMFLTEILMRKIHPIQKNIGKLYILFINYLTQPNVHLYQ